MKTKPVHSGLEVLLQNPPGWIEKARLGLLCNPASVDGRLRHARDLIAEAFPGRLRALYSPQHGFMAEKQDNMVESDHMRDPASGLPIFSLYGQTRIPTPEMLEGIDVLLVDLLDVGTRVYTFASTVSYCLEAARAAGCKVVVLDRPNPVGGRMLEGNCLEESCASFVGRYPIPMRHGLTMGELALLFNGPYGIGCELEVVPMAGWRRAMFFGDTGLPWVNPSPNLPTTASAMVYPGQVIWEGTNISEGRGTTMPFELCGAPFLEPQGLLREMGGREIPGAALRPVAFEPTAHKWAGQLCRGLQIHVTRPADFKPYATSLRLLQAMLRLHGDGFAWKEPPYEYEFRRKPIDLILGSRGLRERLEGLEPFSAIEAGWFEELRAFAALRHGICLYPEKSR